MQQETIYDAIERVKTMEKYLDEISEAFYSEPQSLSRDEMLKMKLKALMEYYFNGMWLSDYDRDDNGEFLQNMKRGVLGQDTLYNLFMDAREVIRECNIEEC